MKVILSILWLGGILFAATPSVNEKLFVVERESESVAIINKGLIKSRMENMHNMNHGIIKFDGADGYLISRDGYVVRFDPVSEKTLNETKTSKSAIGFVIGKTMWRWLIMMINRSISLRVIFNLSRRSKQALKMWG